MGPCFGGGKRGGSGDVSSQRCSLPVLPVCSSCAGSVLLGGLGAAQEGRGLHVPRGALGHLSSVGLWRRMRRGMPGCPVQLCAPSTTQELTGTAPLQILQEDRHWAKADEHLCVLLRLPPYRHVETTSLSAPGEECRLTRPVLQSVPG